MTAKDYIDMIKYGKEFTTHSMICINPTFLMEFCEQLCREQRDILRNLLSSVGSYSA